MARVTFDITMSLDGYVAGPNMTPDQGLGEGGERLHDWAFDTAAWREEHGRTGGRGQRRLAGGGRVRPKRRRAHHGPPHVRRRGRVGQQGVGRSAVGGLVGRRAAIPQAGLRAHHHPREPLVKGETTFTFVTDGIESALAQAQAAAGGKDVAIARRGERLPAVPEGEAGGRVPGPCACLCSSGRECACSTTRPQLPTLECARVLHSPGGHAPPVSRTVPRNPPSHEGGPVWLSRS